jgi:hypothetical protein
MCRLLLRSAVAFSSIAFLAVFDGGVAMAATGVADTPDSTITATYARNGIGLSNVIADAQGKLYPAGFAYLSVQGQETKAFSVDFDNPDVDKTGIYKSTDWTAVTPANLGKATDIATRHDAIGTRFSLSNWEAAAAQVAIWAVTNDVPYKAISNPAFVSRVDALVAGASAAAYRPAPSTGLNLEFLAATDPGTVANRLRATLTTNSGQPFAGKDVTFVVDGTTVTATTNSDGIAMVDIAATTAVSTATATFVSSVSAGVVFAPITGKTPMLTAEPVTATISDSIDQGGLVGLPPPSVPSTTAPPLSALPPAAPAPAPDLAPAPAPAPTPLPGPALTTSPGLVGQATTRLPAPTELPYTGGWAQGWMLAVGLAVAAAGLVGRRLRVQR